MGRGFHGLLAFLPMILGVELGVLVRDASRRSRRKTFLQMIADTVSVTNYLRQRFDEEKIYLLGESWGATPSAASWTQHSFSIRS